MSQCAYVFGEGETYTRHSAAVKRGERAAGDSRAGERCPTRILPKGSELCSFHTPGELEQIHSEKILAEARRHVEDKQVRKPPARFFREGWDRKPFRPVGECQKAFDVTMPTVYRWYAWVDRRDLLERVAEDWSPPQRDYPTNIFDLDKSHLDALLVDFMGFRPAYFKTPRGTPYETPDFQRNWVYEILTALIVGGRLIILSPPRHGKTELLIHVVVWLICRFPNIRIIWIGGNIDIAKQAIGMVLDHLETNDDLIRDFCPPGQQFKPDRHGGLWSQTAFTVATRTNPQKQPTLRAVGRGGRTRSMDTDFIINDDIEDEKSTIQPVTREETRRWWTTGPESRKEEHTALFYIGSRAHPDDLGGHLLDSDEYVAVVEHAHDPACDLPPDDEDAHIECMLFPGLRSYRWLQQQKRAAQASGGQHVFDMLYQNLPSAEGFLPFTAEVVDACRSPSYHIGQIPKPYRPEGVRPEEIGGIRLVAGLDPAGSGYQAAVLWAYQIKPELRMWLVDLENTEGGGIPQARRTIRRWTKTYPGLAHWVIEENLYHGAIVDDEEIRAFTTAHGIRLEAFATYRNKIDRRIGVTAMQSLFAEQRIVLPYADSASQHKTDAYRRQLIYYDPNAPRNRNTRSGYKNDLVMAAWFPMEVIRRAQSEVIAEMGVDYSPSFSRFTGSAWNNAPWARKRRTA